MSSFRRRESCRFSSRLQNREIETVRWWGTSCVLFLCVWSPTEIGVGVGERFLAPLSDSGNARQTACHLLCAWLGVSWPDQLDMSDFQLWLISLTQHWSVHTQPLDRPHLHGIKVTDRQAGQRALFCSIASARVNHEPNYASEHSLDLNGNYAITLYVMHSILFLLHM